MAKDDNARGGASTRSAVARLSNAISPVSYTHLILGWLPFAISILLINTITYDELDKGYGFLMTLPIDAETYVREKYFFCLTGGTVSWLSLIHI